MTFSVYYQSINNYNKVVGEEVEHRAPKDMLADLVKLEAEIQQGIKDLEKILRQ